MKVLYLTSYGGKKAGGLFTTMTSIIPIISSYNIDVELMCLDEDNQDELEENYGKIKIHTYKSSSLPILKQYEYSSELLKKIENVKPDIIHIQGIWLYYSFAAYKYMQSNPNCKIIIQPHGMLDEWAVQNSRWKKRIIGALFENRNLNSASCIHALCKQEYKSIRNYGIHAPIAVLPNGININKDHNIRTVSSAKKTLLYIGRIHPKKGLRELIEALSIIKNRLPDFFKNWSIKIAGWDQHNFQKELENKVVEAELENYVTFLGPVFGKNKSIELSNADAFILSSHSEGLPMTVLEAWSYSLPVVMTDFCNLPEGFTHNAAIKVDPSPESIFEGLIKLNKLSKTELALMGNNGYNLVSEEFQWDKIALDTIKLYEYLLGNAAKPKFLYEK